MSLLRLQRTRTPSDNDQDSNYSPAWLLTFTDMILLLLAFFIFMYSSARTDEDRLQQMLESFRSYLGRETTMVRQQKALTDTAYLEPGEEPPAVVLKRSETQLLREEEGVRVEGRRVQFPPQSAQLSDTDLDVLRETAASLRNRLNRLEIRGHASATEDNAWQLSWQRARAVAEALIAFGVNERRLRICAAGRTEPAPVAEDLPPPARTAADRRVIILDTGEFVR